MKRIIAILALVVGLVSIGPAASAHDVLNDAGKRLAGTCAHNTRTHVLTCVTGTYHYPRVVHYGGKWHTKRFVGTHVSAQHCQKTGCYGAILHANLWSPHQFGHQSRTSSKTGSLCDSHLMQPFCTPVPVSPSLCFDNGDCAQVWDWYQSSMQSYIGTANRLVNEPCVDGAVAGVTGKVGTKAFGALTKLGIPITAAVGRHAAQFTGKAGALEWAVGGCLGGVAVSGYKQIKVIAAFLNPFDKTGVRR